MIADDLAALPYRNEAVADAPFDVLGRQFAQIAIERLDAAHKALSVMDGFQCFDAKVDGHVEALISLLWAAAALCNAGEGGSGFRMASIKVR